MESATLEAPAASPGGEQPAPAAAPAPATVDTFEADSKNLTPDAFKDLMPMPTSKFAPKPVAPPTPAAAEPAAPAPAASPVPTAAAPAEPAAAEAPEATAASLAEAKRLTKNWRVEAKDASEAQVFLLIKPKEHGGKGYTLNQAYSEVYGDTPAKTPSAPAATPAPAAAVQETQPAEDKELTGLQAEIVRIQTDLVKASDEADLKTATNLTVELSRKERALERLQESREATTKAAQAEKVDAAVAKFQQKTATNIAKITTDYPALADVASEERAMFNTRVQAMRQDPDQLPIFDSPSWPAVVAAQLAEERGWKKAGQAPAALAPAAQPAKPIMTQSAPITSPAPAPSSATARATAAEVISPGSGSPGTSFVASRETFERDSANVSPAELIALMAHAPVDPKLLKFRGGRK